MTSGSQRPPVPEGPVSDEDPPERGDGLGGSTDDLERPGASQGADAAETPHKPPKRRPLWQEIPILVVAALLIALVVKSFLLQAFYIPSASMEPTLVEGDRVLVEKLSYRFGEPERGDVVVFHRTLTAPSSEDAPFWKDAVDALRGSFGFRTGGSQDFIKRVIAIGGDTVEGRADRLFVNQRPVSEAYLPPRTDISTFGPIRVPHGSIFVMGDNRTNSDDSRDFGPIAVDSVVGRAFLVIWPPSDVGTL